MSTIDADSRSVERLLPLIHAQLCTPPRPTRPAVTTTANRHLASCANSSETWIESSLARWRRCFHVWRKLIGSDIVFLALLFHAGCLWSPDYAALEMLVADDEASEDDMDGRDGGMPGFHRDTRTSTTRPAYDFMARLHAHEASLWALEVLHFIRLFELYESPALAAESEEAPLAPSRRDDVEREGGLPDDAFSSADEDADDDGDSLADSTRTGNDTTGTPSGAERTAACADRPPPVGHSTVLLEALAARLVGIAVAHHDPITLTKKGSGGGGGGGHGAAVSGGHSSASASFTDAASLASGPAAAASSGASEREEVLKQMLVTVADRDEVVVQHVATALVSRWFALTAVAPQPPSSSTSDTHSAAELRARRDYYLASAIKFAAYVDGVFSALYEENTHMALLLARQNIPAGPLQHLLLTAVPSILCCLLVEEQVATSCGSGGAEVRPPLPSEDVAMPCLVPQAMLLPYHLVGRGSSVAVWLPTRAGQRGGIREEASAFPTSPSSPTATATCTASASASRGQFVPCDVCGDGVLWQAKAPTGTGSATAAMMLALRFRPETWWAGALGATGLAGAAQTAARDVSIASISAVFPVEHAPSSPASPTSPWSPLGTGRGAFEAQWRCDGASAAHSHLRVDALVPRAVFAASLPMASALAPTATAAAAAGRSGGDAGKAATAVSYLGVVEKLVARAESSHPQSPLRVQPLLDNAPTSAMTASHASRKRRRGGAPVKGSRGTTSAPLALAHPLLCSETDSATLLSFSGSSGLSAASTVPWWAALATRAQSTSASASSSAASATAAKSGRKGVRRAGRPPSRANPSASSAAAPASTSAPGTGSGGEGADISRATYALTKLLHKRFHYTTVHMGAARTSATTLRAGMSRDPIAVVAQFLSLTGRRVLALGSLVQSAWQREQSRAQPSSSSWSAPEGHASAVAMAFQRPVAATGIGKGGHHRTAPQQPPPTADTAAMMLMMASMNAPVGDEVESAEARGTAATQTLVPLASSLTLAALVLAHSPMSRVLLTQNAMTLWATEVASTLVDQALLLRARPHAPLLGAAGIGVCILPQRTQSLLVMVGLVAAVAARQREALQQAAPNATATAATLKTSSTSWWDTFDRTVLQDATMPGLFFPGSWRLLESATGALKSAAHTLLKRDTRRAARLGKRGATFAVEGEGADSHRSGEMLVVQDPVAPQQQQHPWPEDATHHHSGRDASRGGLIDVDALWRASVHEPNEAGGRRETQHRLWCSPEAALPRLPCETSFTTEARTPRPSRGPPREDCRELRVAVETGAAACPPLPRAVPHQGEAAPASLSSPSPPPPPPARRLRLGHHRHDRVAPSGLLTVGARVTSDAPQPHTEEAVDADRQLLRRQLQWLWLLAETASDESRQKMDSE